MRGECMQCGSVWRLARARPLRFNIRKHISARQRACVSGLLLACHTVKSYIWYTLYSTHFHSMCGMFGCGAGRCGAARSVRHISACVCSTDRIKFNRMHNTDQPHAFRQTHIPTQTAQTRTQAYTHLHMHNGNRLCGGVGWWVFTTSVPKLI